MLVGVCLGDGLRSFRERANHLLVWRGNEEVHVAVLCGVCLSVSSEVSLSCDCLSSCHHRSLRLYNGMVRLRRWWSREESGRNSTLCNSKQEDF